MNWENSTRYLDNYPKTRLEEGVIGETFHRSGKRRTSHQSTEHELEVRNIHFVEIHFTLVVESKCSVYIYIASIC